MLIATAQTLNVTAYLSWFLKLLDLQYYLQYYINIKYHIKKNQIYIPILFYVYIKV